MLFTITKKLDQQPSHPMLCKLAGQHSVCVTGDERAGSFTTRGVEGNYEFSDAGIHGKFAGHGVTGEFSFAAGEAAVTISDKPFWLPEALLKQKITEGLNMLCDELARSRP